MSRQEPATDQLSTSYPPTESPDVELDRSLPQKFEEVVGKRASAIAVQTGDAGWTYGMLNRTANLIASTIRSLRGDRPEPVALLVEHDALTLASILGILKAGKICVPIDPSCPNERIGYILDDSEARLVLSHGKRVSSCSDLARGDCDFVNLDELGGSLPADNPRAAISGNAIAYILYTSGSTGKPKGVVHNHRTLIHNAMRHVNGCRISENDRVALFASLATGQGTPTALGTLLCGGVLYPWNVRERGIAGLARWLAGEQITILVSAPTIFRDFARSLDGAESFPKLRLIRLGAEQIRKSDVDLYKKHFSPDCVLGVFLSTTETGNITQYFLNKGTAVAGDSVPVGYPVPGLKVRLIDADGREVAANEIGEIEVISRYLSLGYWRNSSSMQAAFAPVAGADDQRSYRTGDRGRIRSDGSLEYLGRSDSRVKVHGVRIDLAEIETALRAHPGVHEVLIDVRTDRSGENRLVAYVVPAPEHAPRPSDLRGYLAEKLPNAMVPSAFMLVDALPVTPIGKLDRQALPAPDESRPDLDTVYVPPRNPLERQLTRIWENVLGVRPVGVKDNFFDLGGDSLRAIQVIGRLENALAARLRPATVVEAGTIERLACIVRPDQPPKEPSSLVVIRERGSKPPFFWVHGDAAAAFLPRFLDPDQPVYELEHQSQDGTRAPHTTVETIAAYYLEQIVTVQRQGPYFLGGYSFGGVVAFEMAHQLQRRGEQVALLVLLDSPYPPKAEPMVYRAATAGSRRSLAGFSHELRRHVGNAARLALQNGFGDLAWRINAHVSGLIAGNVAHYRKTLENLICRTHVALGRTLPPHLRSRYILDVYHRALARYVPEPYRGAAIYVKCEQSSGHRRDVWETLIAGGLTVHEVPGDHLDVRRQSHVHFWAEKLNGWICRAQSTA